MIIVQVKEGENIEKALKKFKRKFEKTGIVRELRSRQAFEKPSVTNRKKMMKAVYVQQLHAFGEYTTCFYCSKIWISRKFGLYSHIGSHSQ